MANPSIWFGIGAISAASAVGLGAFGAHGLRTSLRNHHTEKEVERIAKTYDKGAHYHLTHSLGLMACSLVPNPFAKFAAGFFLGGMTLFSGSLYAMAVTGEKRLGPITPIGGVAFIAGWLTLAFARLRRVPL
eukprot:TRINITY_DN3085_c0_g1_i1.p1 TRINITY_DN3085_c0_g1~~TRINITY_DN3085_c0_g1_i1.p1  ORF type:complete len:132 (-),score=21.49 TRINITY_DN3085_c0_g1_i1:38-433(-)